MTNDSQLAEFHKYEVMRDAGASAEEVYRVAKADGLKGIACIKMLRRVFHLSLVEAKEVTVVGDGLADSLDEYQGKLAKMLEKLQELDEEYPE